MIGRETYTDSACASTYFRRSRVKRSGKAASQALRRCRHLKVGVAREEHAAVCRGRGGATTQPTQTFRRRPVEVRRKSAVSSDRCPDPPCARTVLQQARGRSSG